MFSFPYDIQVDQGHLPFVHFQSDGRKSLKKTQQSLILIQKYLMQHQEY